jgi:hypothetical protein
MISLFQAGMLSLIGVPAQANGIVPNRMANGFKVLWHLHPSMTTAKASLPTQPAAPVSAQDKLLENIIGVAIFDFSGLPREYFVTADNTSTSWVQIVFQALGLKSLLMSSLNVEGFSHITIELGPQTAVVVRTKEEYVALLLRTPIAFSTAQESDRFSHWVRQFERQILRKHDRFVPA